MIGCDKCTTGTYMYQRAEIRAKQIDVIRFDLLSMFDNQAQNSDIFAIFWYGLQNLWIVIAGFDGKMPFE